MGILSILAIIGSLFVVTAKSTVLSIIWLVAVFIFSALILAYLGLTYAALTYVIVYVGAIAILFLFVVQLLDQRSIEASLPDSSFKTYLPLGGLKINDLFKKEVWPFSIILGILLIIAINPLMTYFGPIFSFKYLYSLVLLDSSFFSKGTSFASSDYLAIYSNSFTQKTLGVDSLYVPTLENDFIASLINQGPIPTHLYESNHLFNNRNVENLLTSKGQVQNLGQWLYGIGSMPLIVTSVILLLAMVGPIMLCWSYI